MKKLKVWPFFSKGLNYKLKIGFYLMANAPLVVCIYLILKYIWPFYADESTTMMNIILLLLLMIVISNVGFFVLKKIFDHIISVSKKAELIATGDFSHEIEIKRQDELGSLDNALNQLTQRIRKNMDELDNYNQKTAELNLEIQRRIFVFSSLLQISSLISQDLKLDNLLRIIVEKSRLLNDSEVTYILFRDEGSDAFYVKSCEGINADVLLKIRIGPEEKAYDSLSAASEPVLIDNEHKSSTELSKYFQEKFGFKNLLSIPIYLKGKVKAFLGSGNRQDNFTYNKDNIELLDIFAKQAAIAIENDILLHRLEKLEIKDALTGLYNDSFIRNRLQEEIKRAAIYQRPCSFLGLSIDNFASLKQALGQAESEAVLKKVASLIRDSVTEIDRVARIQEGEFAIVLPERNKRQAHRIAEEIKVKIESNFKHEQDSNKHLTITTGVSENPLDGVDAQELIAKARNALNEAE
ncbi:MAG: diguanylate cyclase domain-containing protein [Deltaproteobacteria bacterium]